MSAESPLTDESPRPEVFEGELGPVQLSRRLRDLADHADVRRVTTRGGERAAVRACTLDDVADLLAVAGHGVQITYCFEGSEWTDTLRRTPTAVHIVRVQRGPQEQRGIA